MYSVHTHRQTDNVGSLIFITFSTWFASIFFFFVLFHVLLRPTSALHSGCAGGKEIERIRNRDLFSFFYIPLHRQSSSEAKCSIIMNENLPYITIIICDVTCKEFRMTLLHRQTINLLMILGEEKGERERKKWFPTPPIK